MTVNYAPHRPITITAASANIRHIVPYLAYNSCSLQNLSQSCSDSRGSLFQLRFIYFLMAEVNAHSFCCWQLVELDQLWIIWLRKLSHWLPSLNQRVTRTTWFRFGCRFIFLHFNVTEYQTAESKLIYVISHAVLRKTSNLLLLCDNGIELSLYFVSSSARSHWISNLAHISVKQARQFLLLNGTTDLCLTLNCR